MPRTLKATKRLSDTMYSLQEAGMLARQVAYVAENGVYFQGLDTHTTMPSDGNDSSPDFARTPTDQQDGWTPTDFPPAMPASLAIDCHDNKGFVTILSFFYSGKQNASQGGVCSGVYRKENQCHYTKLNSILQQQIEAM